MHIIWRKPHATRVETTVVAAAGAIRFENVFLAGAFILCWANKMIVTRNSQFSTSHLDKTRAASSVSPPESGAVSPHTRAVLFMESAGFAISYPERPVIMPTVEIILKEKITGLGAEADIVKVRAGYARNFLVPQGKALEATRANKTRLKTLQSRRAEREAKELAEAEAVAAKLKKVTLKLTLKTGADGKAFGSVTAHDIGKALEEQGPKNLVLERHAIQLEKAIKQTGKFEVPVRVHHDVTATIKVVVSPESGETPAAAEEAAE